MSTPLATPTRAMQAGAAQLLAEPARWTAARRKADGRPFFIVRGRTSTYYTAADGAGCTCPGYRRRGLCSHSLAATIRRDRERTAACSRAWPPSRPRSGPTPAPSCGRSSPETQRGPSRYATRAAPATRRSG